MPRREDSSTGRVLLTGVGSGVGRCVLEVLTGRRGDLTLVGADLDPQAPALRHCDAAVTLPPDDHPEFLPVVEQLCQEWQIDLVIPCRDPAIPALAAASADPQSAITALAPPAELALATQDKLRTSQWCEEIGIHFAPTVATDSPTALEDLEQMRRDFGFPLICKPRRGSGSLGVRVITSPAQLERAAREPDMILQPFLDPPDQGSLAPDLAAGAPLFWEVPCTDEPAFMAVIGPTGTIGPICCFTATHRLGRNENLRASTDPGLADFAARTVGRLADIGWRGPLNVQVRYHRSEWQIIEINPRFSGGTAGRLLLGFDEVGWTLREWLPGVKVPEYTGPVGTEVSRHLVDELVR